MLTVNEIRIILLYSMSSLYQPKDGAKPLPVTETKTANGLNWSISDTTRGCFMRLHKPHGDDEWHHIAGQGFYSIPIHLGNQWYWFSDYWTGTEDIITETPIRFAREPITIMKWIVQTDNLFLILRLMSEFMAYGIDFEFKGLSLIVPRYEPHSQKSDTLFDIITRMGVGFKPYNE